MFTHSMKCIGSVPFLACTALASAAIIDVPEDFATIQAAVDAASNGDVVRVADGTWNNVQIVGKSITLRSASGSAEDCVIFGTGTGLLLFGNGNDSLVQDMTLKGSRGLGVEGNARGTIERCVVSGDATGGVFFNSLSLTMRECEISDSASPNAGAGILFTDGDLELIDCLIEDNQITTSTAEGGGVYSSDVGGSVLISGCTFHDNGANGSTSGRGGGLYLERKTDVTIVDSAFTSNDASGEGAGVYLFRTSASFLNCRFSQNISSGGGGGLWIDNAGGTPNLVTMTNCLVDRNEANGGSGAGIRQLTDSNLVLGNCTIAWNTTGGGGGAGVANANGSTATATNCIVRGNSNGQIAGAGVEVVTYSNVQGGMAGAGNINLDPQWIDPIGGDYHLVATSPGIDAGDTPAYSGLPIDLDCNPRLVDAPGMADSGISIIGKTIDMGCYEFTELPTASCEGDVTNDGIVDVNDLVAVLLAWGVCP